MSSLLPFTPGVTFKISTSGASAVSLTIPASVYGQTLAIYNSSTTITGIVNLLGNAAVVPDTTAVTGANEGVCPPNQTTYFTRPAPGQADTLSFIRDGASDITFYVMVGDGGP